MADKWCLTPLELSPAMARSALYQLSEATYAAALSARPPIPRPVWDAMVERGARGIAEARLFDWGRIGDATMAAQFLFEAASALRAALNNPRVEGDEGEPNAPR